MMEFTSLFERGDWIDVVLKPGTGPNSHLFGDVQGYDASGLRMRIANAGVDQVVVIPWHAISLVFVLMVEERGYETGFDEAVEGWLAGKTFEQMDEEASEQGASQRTGGA